MCHNCAGCAARLNPLPQTLAGIRHALRRDRRDTERRHGAPDRRVYRHDRRNGDRRADRAGDVIDDGMIVEIHDLASELAADVDPCDAAPSEMTRIHDSSAR
jgi:hypothetical protein